MHDVYISFSQKDKKVANEVYNELEAHGIKCWMAPKDIALGEAWDEAISNAIENCRIMIIIFSSHVNDSGFIRNEINLGFQKGCQLIPFRIEDTLPERELFYLNRTQWLDALTEPLDKHIQKLVEIVASSIEQIESPTHPKEPEINAYAIELKYNPISSEYYPLIEGTVHGAVGESLNGFQIEFEENSSQWRSSKWRLNTEGAFMTRVHAEPNYKNEFKIILTDNNGDIKPTVPESFPYTIITQKRKYSPKKPLVFISHYSLEGSNDKIIAHAVYGELEAHGIKCWIAPNDILPGVDWDDAIAEAIEECVIMIVIFSDNVNSSDYIKKEVHLAADEGLNLITFRIEDALPKKGLKLQLNKIQWVDAFTEPLNAHIQKLVKAVDALNEMTKI